MQPRTNKKCECGEEGEKVGVVPQLKEAYKNTRRCKNRMCDYYNQIYSIK